MFIEIDGIKTNYIDEGNKDGEIVLLLHGWGSNIKLWDNVIQHLKPYYRVIAPDMAGFGETEEPEEAWSVDDYVEFIKKFCKKLFIKKAILFGHSFGGRVIIKLLSGEGCPIFVPKIVLTDSAGIMPKHSLYSRIRTRGYKISKAFFSTPPIKRLFPDMVSKMRQKRGSADYNAASPVMRATLVKVVNEDLTYLLEKIKPPTLLVWGDKDDQTPVSDGKLMEKLMPDAGLVVLENAGHFAYIDQWYTYSRVIDSFLEINRK